MSANNQKGRDRLRTLSNHKDNSDNENESEREEESMLSEFKNQMKKQSELINALKDSFKFMSDNFDKFQKEMKVIRNEQKAIRSDIKNIQQTEEKLKKQIDIIESKIIKQQQESNFNNMVVTNMPKFRTQADVVKVIEKIAHQVQYELKKEEIIDTFQIESKNKKSFPIIVKLTNNKFKVKCMNFRKEKNVIDMKKIGTNINSNKNKNINFYHFLEREYSILYDKAKEIAKQKNYKFVWYANATIFIRKEENSKIIKIRNMHELDRIE